VLGISPITPRFVRNFLPESTSGIPGAIAAYVQAVKTGAFPAPEHCYA
jgi:3-methyl-2-oxobutanoate hydroxymethyltransferase